MSEHTAIEWCDSTFNPWIGCTRVSPGCDHCYAAVSTPARTLGVEWGPHAERRRTSKANWRGPLRWEREHETFMAEHGRRRRVFCASLADVFDNAVPQEWRADLFDLISATPHLDWLLLTKRIGNVGNMLPVPFDFERIYPNVWLGITVCDQAEADRDIPKLLDVPARVRFLSIEPMLGPIDLRRWLGPQCDNGSVPGPGGVGGVTCPRCGGQRGHCLGLTWVIAGGESGPKARPAHPDWFRSLRDQCDEVGTPFLFKQWGEWGPFSKPSHYPAGVAPDGSTVGPDEQFTEDCALMYRIGTKSAGRLLDGVVHDAWPNGL